MFVIQLLRGKKKKLAVGNFLMFPWFCRGNDGEEKEYIFIPCVFWINDGRFSLKKYGFS